MYLLRFIAYSAILFSALVGGQENFDAGLDAYLEGNYEQAYQVWRDLAEAGDHVAMFNVGVMYAQGKGVEKDMSEAVKWYRRSAEAGYAPAQFNLGSAYLDGQGVDVDKRRALEWWTKAAAQDHPRSLFNLGTLYLQGNGVEANETKALELYGRAADHGDARARTLVERLSKRRETKQAVEPPSEAPGKEPVETPAVPVVDKAAATASNSDEANSKEWILRQNPEHLTLQLAAYSNESSLRKFVNEHQLDWRRVAYFRVRQNNLDRYKLIFGVFTDAQRAEAARAELPQAVQRQRPWMRPFSALQEELAQQDRAHAGETDVAATRPQEDDSTTQRPVSTGAARGTVDAVSEASLLAAGQKAFNAQDYAKAVEIWRPLAVRGLPEAQYNLGFMYESGWGLERDPSRAAEWYRFAAEQGFAKAQFNLGVLYMEGRGVDRNKGLGLYWIQSAADRDDKRAADYIKDYHARR